MQVFFTDKDPVKCAEFLDDRRVTKMVTETAQILSTALHEHGSPLRTSVYRATHRHHPCVRWASSSRGNYLWLLRHFKALALEFNLRNGKVHGSWRLAKALTLGALSIPAGRMTEPANVAKRKSKGIDFSHLDPVDHAYQIYLNARWDIDHPEPVWTSPLRDGDYYDNLSRYYGLVGTGGPIMINTEERKARG